MAGSRRNPPDPTGLLTAAVEGDKPVAIVLAGHNGSGKSTLWYDKLADNLKIPLVNADRLTMSILPPPLDQAQTLRPWAASLRDKDERWQKLSQEGVQLFMGLIMDQHMPFAFETVFSYLKKQTDGSYKSKADTIIALQKAGYFVILLFVGLASPELSILRVNTRRLQGGHDVPEAKLKQRFPRTQEAVRLAAPVSDMTIMFDNSRTIDKAFSLVRAQTKTKVTYDCRDSKFTQEQELIDVADAWLSKVAPL
ncbi:MAG: Zeta toxin family protein [Acidobacteriaceae bacterium]|nr:Zeta toxin family protein [Acidobacteriaceae bacterium]